MQYYHASQKVKARNKTQEVVKSRKIQQWVELHFRRSLIGIVFCVCHHRLPTFIPFLESVSATLALSSKVVLEVASLADLQEIRWTFLWSNFGRRYIRIVAAVVIKAEDKTDKLFFLLILSTFACYIEETDESFKANFRHLNYSKSSFQGVTLECFLVYPMINRYRNVPNLETDRY